MGVQFEIMEVLKEIRLVYEMGLYMITRKFW